MDTQGVHYFQEPKPGLLRDGRRLKLEAFILDYNKL